MENIKSIKSKQENLEIPSTNSEEKMIENVLTALDGFPWEGIIPLVSAKSFNTLNRQRKKISDELIKIGFEFFKTAKTWKEVNSHMDSVKAEHANITSKIETIASKQGLKPQYRN